MAERRAPTGTISGPCLSIYWQTPPELVSAVRVYFGGVIPFDAATTRGNPCRADSFCVTRGLTMEWPRQVWCNPPYGVAIRDWLAKMGREAEPQMDGRVWTPGLEIVTLLPCSRWEQAYFQQFLERANAVCWIRKRVRFINPETGDRPSGNPYASMFVGLNVDTRRFAEAVGHLGLVQALRPLNQAPKE